MKVRGIVQGVQPQSKEDRLWPAGVCMKQLLARTLQEVMDGLLGNAILEVGIYPTKRKLLSHIVAYLSEGVVMEAPIVAVVLHDFDSMFGRVLFKSNLAASVLADLLSSWRWTKWRWM